MQNRKIAGYGALASLPWIVIETYVLAMRHLHDSFFLTKPFWEPVAVSFGAAAILGISCGAVGGVLIVKVHERYRGRLKNKSRAAAYSLLTFLVWAIIYLSISLIDLSRLFGMILWALVLAHFIDSEARQAS